MYYSAKSRSVVTKHGPARHDLAAFGQEWYPDDAARCLRLALEVETRAELHARLAATQPQASDKTRLRIADKLIQRLVPVETVVTPHMT